MSLPSRRSGRPEGPRGLPRGRPDPFNPEWVRRLLEALECESTFICLRLLDVLRRAVSDERALRWARAIWEFRSHPRWWSGEVEDRDDLPPGWSLPVNDVGESYCRHDDDDDWGCLSCDHRHWYYFMDRLPRLTIGSCCATPLEALLARPDRAILYREACSLGAEGCFPDVVQRSHPLWDAALFEAAAAAGPLPRRVGEALLRRAVWRHAPERITELLDAGVPREWSRGSPPPPSAVSDETWVACVTMERGLGPRSAAEFVQLEASELLLIAPWLEAVIAGLPRYCAGEVVRTDLRAEVQRATRLLARWSEPRAAWLGAALRGIRRRVASQRPPRGAAARRR